MQLRFRKPLESSLVYCKSTTAVVGSHFAMVFDNSVKIVDPELFLEPLCIFPWRLLLLWLLLHFYWVMPTVALFYIGPAVIISRKAKLLRSKKELVFEAWKFFALRKIEKKTIFSAVFQMILVMVVASFCSGLQFCIAIHSMVR